MLKWDAFLRPQCFCPSPPFAAASHYARPRHRRSRRTVNGSIRPARVEVHLNHALRSCRNPETGVCREASGPEIQVAKDARTQDARTPECKPTASRHRKPTGQTQGTQGRLCSRHRISGLASPITVAPAHSRPGRDARRKTQDARRADLDGLAAWASDPAWRCDTKQPVPLEPSTTNAQTHGRVSPQQGARAV